MITSEQLQKERSEFYKIGYKMGYLTLGRFLKEIMIPSEFELYRERIKKYYDSHPCIEPLNLDELKEQ